MRNRVLLLLAFALLFFSVNGWGATYYVKNGGNDGASGTSDGTAWATLSKVQGFVFSPGDTILFKRGSSWTGSLSISQSGASGNRITYGAYGSGALPIIDSQNGNDTVSIVNKSYVTIEYLDLRYPSNASVFVNGGNFITVDHCELGRGTLEFGIKAVGWSAGQVSDLVISNNVVHTHAASDFGDGEGPSDGIRIDAGVNNSRIYNNIVTDFGHSGIAALRWSPDPYPMNNNWIYNNTVTNTSVVTYGRGISFDSTDPSAAGNRIFNNNFFNLRTVSQLNANGTMFYNNIMNNVHSSNPDPADGCLALQSYSGTYATNMKIYNNVFANCGQSGLTLRGGEPNRISGNEIVNNVFYNNSINDYQLWVDDSANIGGNLFKNNLFYKSGVTNLIRNGHNSSSDYSRTVTQFNSDNGKGGDVITGNVGGNPLFMSSSDFHLGAGSPAIDAGIDVGITGDFGGNPRVGFPDIGAYEYLGGGEASRIPQPPSTIQIN